MAMCTNVTFRCPLIISWAFTRRDHDTLSLLCFKRKLLLFYHQIEHFVLCLEVGFVHMLWSCDISCEQVAMSLPFYVGLPNLTFRFPLIMILGFSLDVIVTKFLMFSSLKCACCALFKDAICSFALQLQHLAVIKVT